MFLFCTTQFYIRESTHLCSVVCISLSEQCAQISLLLGNKQSNNWEVPHCQKVLPQAYAQHFRRLARAWQATQQLHIFTGDMLVLRQQIY